jgi:hypothetical protein
VVRCPNYICVLCLQVVLLDPPNVWTLLSFPCRLQASSLFLREVAAAMVGAFEAQCEREAAARLESTQLRPTAPLCSTLSANSRSPVVPASSIIYTPQPQSAHVTAHQRAEVLRPAAVEQRKPIHVHSHGGAAALSDTAVSLCEAVEKQETQKSPLPHFPSPPSLW